MEIQPKIYLPGQTISTLPENCTYNSNTIYKDNKNNLIALYPGILNSDYLKSDQPLQINNNNNTLTLITNIVLYSPTKGELIIGVIRARLQDTYLIDINSSMDGILNHLQFDNATKKNKPNLNVGTCVYCRVVEINKYLGVTLSCVNKGYTSKNNPNQLGELKKGTLLHIQTVDHAKIQKRLTDIAKFLAFEIAFGKNGTIWIVQNGQNVGSLVLISNCIKAVQQDMPDQAIEAICKSNKI